MVHTRFVLLAAAAISAAAFAGPTRESSHAWLDVDTKAYAGNVREFRKIERAVAAEAQQSARCGIICS
jgi:hypothetical protein